MALAAMLCLASFAWVVARIWKTSAILAVASIVCWPLALCALLRNWGDEENDLRLPVGAFGVALAIAAWTIEAQRYAA